MPTPPFNLMKWIEDHRDEFKVPVMNRQFYNCLLYTSPSPRDQRGSRMPSSA